MLTAFKAHRLSTQDVSQTPVSTTTPDDAFYILKTVLSRMLTTASQPTVERTSELLRDVMDKDYARVIKTKLDNVYKGNAAAPGVRGLNVERENRQSFIVSIDVRMCTHLTNAYRSYSMTLTFLPRIWNA